MDLFGSAPNLKCSNEAVCYNAAASPQTLSNNRKGSLLGFDCIVPNILLVDKLHYNSQSSSVLFDSMLEAFEQSLFLVIVTVVYSFYCTHLEFIKIRSATSPSGLSNLDLENDKSR